MQSAYCSFELTDSTKRTENLANAAAWGRLIRASGGRVAVIGPNSVNRSSFDIGASRSTMISMLNDIGRTLADAGVVGAVHPHTGSCIQSRDEVRAVMDGIDLRLVGLAPDVGELTAAGVDPMPIIHDYASLIRHAHLKDYDGGPSHDGYCPLGSGRVDMKAVTAALEALPADVAIMVELNPSANGAPSSPRDAASKSKRYLESLGYTFTK